MSIHDMKTIAIIDTETSSLDPETGEILEVACVVWSLEHRCIITAWSELINGDTNQAEHINRISAASRSLGDHHECVFEKLRTYVNRADVIAAHNADFDRGFLTAKGCTFTQPWFDTMDMVQWPRESGKSLVAIALAHGVGVESAHRALQDCLLLARLFERVAEQYDLSAMLTRALRPSAVYQAQVSYQDKDLAKQAGFRYFPDPPRWTRRMAHEDVAALSFPVVNTELAPISIQRETIGRWLAHTDGKLWGFCKHMEVGADKLYAECTQCRTRGYRPKVKS